MTRALCPAAAHAALALAVTACGLPLADEEASIENTCTQSADCGDGVCVPVGGASRCVATTADLGGLVFELEGATADGRTIAHVFEQGLSIQGSRSGGIVVGHDLDVPPPLLLRGRFLHHAPDAVELLCAGPDGSIPVEVEVRSSDPLIGLERVFQGESTATEGAEGTTHAFAIPVPPGTYDVYVAPLPNVAPGCPAPPPPRSFAGVKVESDVALEPEAEAPRRLTGVIVPGSGIALETYAIELLEPKRGLRVSEAPPIEPPVDGQSRLLGGPTGTDEAGIAYYYTEGLVLRLSDPEGRLVVHWRFDALDVDGDGEVRLDLADLVAQQAEYRARVIGPDGRPVAAASVSIKSVSLTGEAGKNASFGVTAESDAEGIVAVNLVPGVYQVLVVPPTTSGATQDGPAQLETEWTITEDLLCCGHAFELPARPLLTGSIATAAGDPVVSVPVLASPTLPGTRDYFARALGALDLLPRQVSSTTEASGLFAMAVDPGTFDVTVQAPTSTGFGWLVLPATVVAPVDQQPGAPLGALALPSPAVVVGRATREGVPASDAIVRAYLPLVDDDGGTPSRVVTIGEVVTDADGNFVLPLPPSIARDASPEGSGGAATTP